MNLVEHKQKQGGFTLLELMVTIAIMITLMSVLLFNQRRFGLATAGNNSAEQVSIALREAQVYASGSKNFRAGSSNFNVNYGVFFDTAVATQMTLFGDCYPNLTTPNYKYDTNGCPIGGNESVRQFTFDPKFRVTRLCVNTAADPASPTCPTNTTTLNVVFNRGNLDAVISRTGSDRNNYAEIELRSLDNSITKVVAIWSSGRMYIK